MAFSNYPHGFKNGITIRGLPLDVVHPGKVHWVGNNATRLDNEKTAADGNDGTFLAPFLTIEGALNDGDVVASRGDVIFVRPGHTLAVTAETTLALDKAGIAIIGLGTGTNRPTITHTAPSGTILVTAANVTFKNFLHTVAGTQTLGVDKAFHVSSTDFTMEDVEFRDLAASANFVAGVQLGGGADATANQADRFSMRGCKFQLLSTLGGVTKALPINVEAVTDSIEVANTNVFSASLSAEGIVRVAASYNVTNLLIKDCISMRAPSATAGTVGAIVSGGGTGAAGSGGSGALIRCMAAVGTTLSNNRYVSANALTSGIVVDCNLFSGAPEATAARTLIVQTLNQPAQFS